MKRLTVKRLALTPADAGISITCDPRDPAAGNMSHEYVVEYPVTGCKKRQRLVISFQHGPVLEAGRNGISIEDLIAIVLDRLQGAQAGPFACRENALAITNIEQGLLWLQARSLDRVSRGVEGVSKR